MSDDNEIVELKLDELNELLFRVKVVGADFPPNAFRLVCEDQALSYSFSGELTEEDDVVRFVIPPMVEKVAANRVLDAAIEVLVENRFFRPVSFSVRFKDTVKCVVESVQVKPKEEVKVVASRASVVASKPVERSPQASFSIKQGNKPAQQQVVAHPITLREKFETKKRGTGIDEKTMEEIAKSTVTRLIAMDSDDKKRK